jgi:hypothetical protein
MSKPGEGMKEKPDIEKVKEVVPEAENFKVIGSGGFKVVYRAVVRGKIEAVKLVQIPSDESDETIRDENLRRVARELDILSKGTDSQRLSAWERRVS